MSNRLNVNDVLQPGQDRWSPNGKYQLLLQKDANLCLYYKFEDATNAVWSTNTHNAAGSSGYSLKLQGDGNLVLSNAHGPVWASNSEGYGASSSLSPHVVLQDDGNLCLYDNNVKGCHWATNTTGRTH